MMEHFRNESDVGMLVVVEQLFGRVVVCENLKTAFDIAQITQLICTTCEGDVVILILFNSTFLHSSSIL